MAWGERSQQFERKIRYGVVGLGWSAQSIVLPSFKRARASSELVALVSDDLEVRATLAKRYGVDSACSLDAFDDLLASGSLDAVYLALPTAMHRDFTQRAARRGVHVMCDAPMAATETDCAAMIRACDDHHVKLMIAYRFHYELCHLDAVEIVQSGSVGDPRFFHAFLTRPIAADLRNDDTRYGESAAIAHVALDCIHAARTVFQDEPTEACAMVATGPDPRFSEIGEMISVVLRFPGDRLATIACSFGAFPGSSVDVVGAQGRLRIEPAFDRDAALKHELTIGDKTHVRKFTKRDSMGHDIEYFSDCIARDLMPDPSGWEGLADIRIVQAIHRAIATRQTVKIARPTGAMMERCEGSSSRPSLSPRSHPKLHAASRFLPV